MELSDRGKKAFNEAFESVRQSGDARLGTMHLLVGILRDGRSPAVRALDEVGIDLRGAMIHMSVLSQLERQDGEERVKGLLETLLSRFRR
jgi:ATP-dependent Clp protease ATP-binding subunit ClpA